MVTKRQNQKMLNTIEGKQKKKPITLFEDFIEYCKEDNEELAADIQTWLADYFDLSNRETDLNEEEKIWIKKNLSEEGQRRIFGFHAFPNEKVDETTNEIMDMIRDEFKLDEDSNKDDEIYGFIHHKIRTLIEE